MGDFSFLHCGDVHLGNLQFNEPQRLEDFAGAFAQVVSYALKEKADFVLIAGDFFHKRAINAQTLEQAVNLLEPLKKAGIPVVAIEGNHDKAFYQDKNSWLSFLNNRGYLYLLGNTFSEGKLLLKAWDEEQKTGSWLDLPGLPVRVYGLGYLGITTSARLEEAWPQVEEKNGRYQVLMLHTAVNRLLNQDLGGIRREILTPWEDRVDYLALGHIHSRYESDGWLHNPGSLEWVHLDEYKASAEKGFYHIRVTAEGQQVKYIPSGVRPVCLYRGDLSDTGSPEEAYSKIREGVKKEEPIPGCMMQVILTGNTVYSPLSLDLEGLSSSLKEEWGALYVEVQNQTNTPVSGSLEEKSSAKREEIERLVFGQLLAGSAGLQEGCLDTAVMVVQKIKELALQGGQEEEIRGLLQRYGPEVIKEDAPPNEAGGEVSA